MVETWKVISSRTSSRTLTVSRLVKTVMPFSVATRRMRKPSSPVDSESPRVFRT